jgi:hypothetical protein
MLMRNPWSAAFWLVPLAGAGRDCSSDINAAIDKLCYVQIVVLNKCYAPTHVVITRIVIDALNQITTRSIGWMRLAGKDNLIGFPLVKDFL